MVVTNGDLWALLDFRTPNFFCVMILILIIIIIVVVYLFTVDKKFYIALDKANWSQPKMEKSYIYIKA